MRRITSRAELLESLKDVMVVEIKARHGYEEDIITFRNYEISNTISKIKLDEDEHVRILDMLIELLSK